MTIYAVAVATVDEHGEDLQIEVKHGDFKTEKEARRVCLDLPGLRAKRRRSVKTVVCEITFSANLPADDEPTE